MALDLVKVTHSKQALNLGLNSKTKCRRAVKSDTQFNESLLPVERKGQLTCYHESSRGVRDEVFRVMFVEPVVFLAP